MYNSLIGIIFVIPKMGRESLQDIFKNINITDLINYFITYTGYRNPLDIVKAIVDVGIVSYVCFKIVQLVKETRAWQLLKGVIVIIVAAYLSGWLGLKTVEFILKNTIQLFAFALFVLFQPELRRGLEQLGRNRFQKIFSFEDGNGSIKTSAMIEEIVKTAFELSKTQTGALIVIEKETKIGEIIDTGTDVDAKVTAELLMNIFTPNTPLHDGAVILRDNRLKAAACFLPLTDNPNLSKDLGTRHRAALGITEVSDAIAVIVSEETGKISFALNGSLTRNLTTDNLRKALNKNLIKEEHQGKKISIWKVKSK